MRALVDAPRLREFMRALGRGVTHPARVYFTGGATAVLHGWRDSTIDVDLKLVPDDEILRAIPALKERLSMNIELAAPDDFIPVRNGWEERSAFVAQEGPLTFFHFDLVERPAEGVMYQGVRDSFDSVQDVYVEPTALQPWAL